MSTARNQRSSEKDGVCDARFACGDSSDAPWMQKEAGVLAYDQRYYCERLEYLCDARRHQANASVIVTVYHSLYGKFPNSVLELGCGFGVTVSMLRLLGIEAVGTENSEYLLRGPLSRNPYIVRPIGHRVPLASHSFDVVFSTDFLEHFPCDQVDAVIAEHLRLARGLVYTIICFPEHHSKQDDLYHLCLRPKQWWMEKFIRLGARVVGETPFGLFTVPAVGGRSSNDPPPRISVVIPCHNQGRFLAEAVQSVSEQTMKNWEVIIVNDGSSDETETVALQMTNAYGKDRIHYIRQPNFGVAIARNVGIQHARGKYILPLDADDALRPTFLEETVEVLEHFPEVGIVYTHVQEFGDSSGVWECQPWDAQALVRANLLPYASVFRKEVWESVGGYDPVMREGYEDWEFWVSAAARGWTGTCVPKKLFLYRRRRGSRSEVAQSMHEALVAKIREKHREWIASLDPGLCRTVL